MKHCGKNLKKERNMYRGDTMGEEKIDKKLRELKWKDADKNAMERHKKEFEQSLLRYVVEENKKENRKKKTRFSFTYALMGVLVFILLFSINRYMQRQTFYELLMKNPTETKMYDDMTMQPSFKIRINKITEDKKLGIVHLYTNVQNSIIVVDSKEKEIIGVGIPLYDYDKKIHKYQSQIVFLTDSEKNKAKEIALNSPFNKRLSAKSVIVKNPTVYMLSYEKELLYRVAAVKVALPDEKSITVFVDLTRNRILDIIDAQNVLGELITKDPDIHNFLYMLDGE
jgi:hypothetical protein